MSDAWDFIAGKDTKTNVVPATVDRGAYQYGGQEGGAQADIDRARQMGADAQNRSGVAMNQNQFNADRKLDYQARDSQGRALDAYGNAMNGEGTSVAQGLLNQGTNAAVANASSLAAGSRGGGANLAAAQRAAINAGSSAIGQGAQSAAILRAKEISDARAGYAGVAGAMRGQDQGRMGQSAQWAQSQAQLQDAQRGRNDAFQLANEGSAYGVAGKQLDAQTARATAETGAQSDANKAKQAQNQGNAEKDAGLFGRVAQVGGSTVASVASGNSDETNKTGIQPIESDDAWNAKVNTPGPTSGRGKTDLFGNIRNKGGEGGSAGVNLGDAATDIQILAHPGEGAGPAHGDEANAKIHAGKMYYGGGNQHAGDIAFGDTPVYTNNAGGVSSVEGGAVGSESNSRSPIQVQQLRNSMVGSVRSDAHSKEKIESLSAENEALKKHASGFAKFMADGGVAGTVGHAAKSVLAYGKPAPVVAPAPEPGATDALTGAAAQAMVQRDGREVTQAELDRLQMNNPRAAFGPVDGVDRSVRDTAPEFVQPLEKPSGPRAPALTSDRTTKEGAALSNGPVASFMDHLQPYSFNYKPGVPGEDPNHRYAGVMAQDVEKSPMGKTIVENTADGKKLDVQHGFGTALAALGNLNDRLKQLEGGGGKRTDFHYGPKRGA